MKKYSEYKDSKIELLGQIPRHWAIKKVKNLTIKIGSGITPKGGADVYQISGIPLLRSQNIHFAGLRLDDVAFITKETHDSMSNSEVSENDVLLNITGASIGRCFYADKSIVPANVNQHVCILRPNNSIEKKYLYLLLASKWGQFQIDYCQNGANREGLNFEQIKNFIMPIPPKEERLKITHYLEGQLFKIDSLIKNKKKMFELLKEERVSIVSQAVTKGINPDAKMKDSGIEWLGEVPKHWDVKRIQETILRLETGVSVNSSDEPADNNNIGVLKTSCVFGNRFVPNENKKVLKEEIPRVKCPVRKGSLIISRMNTPALVGSCGYVIKDYPNLFLPDRLWQVIYQPQYNKYGKFLWYFITCQRVKSWLAIIATGTSDSMKNIGQQDFLKIPIPIPSITEQQSISSFLDQKTSQIDASINQIEKEIALIEEFRMVLINEALTGKVDVRGQR